MRRYCIFLGAIINASLCFAQQARTTLDGVYSAVQAKQGETIFLENCASCHGSEGGGTEGGPALKGADVSQWNGVTLNQLFERIKTTMPQNAPGSLADRQYANVLAFILSKNGFPTGSADLPFEPESLAQITYSTTGK